MAVIAKTDVQAELQYDFIDNLLVDVGAKVGYRMMQVDFEQDQRPDLQLEFRGVYRSGCTLLMTCHCFSLHSSISLRCCKPKRTLISVICC